MSRVGLSSTLAAPRQRNGSAVLVFTDAERSQVLAHLEDVYASSAFRNSKRYCALLRYVVARALDGQADQVKERTIGVEAFGRPPDYDTNSDHCVRSAAGEVRRRLAQFYLETGGESSVRIEIPPGSYVPQFRFIEPSVVLPEPKPVALAPIALPAVEHSDSPPRRAWRRREVFVVLTAAAILLSVGFVAGSVWQRPAAFDELWNPIFHAPEAALLCFGGGAQPVEPSRPDRPLTLLDFERSPARRMNVSDAMALVAVTGTLRAHAKPYRILNRAASTSLQDLRQGPFVLIGAMNNDWTLRLTSGLRYSFARNDSVVYIADRNDPKNSRWSFTSETPVAQPARDYAIVTRLRDPITQQIGLILAGIGSWGTQAAGEFVSNPENVRKLEGFAPRDWSQKNVQVVLATDIIRGSSGPPIVLAAYFW